MTTTRKPPTTPTSTTPLKRERADNETSQTIQAAPLTLVQPPKARGVGRPEKLVMPPLPEMDMTDVERELFDYFLASYHAQYPDLVPTDHLLLHLAACEYIKYMRVLADEMRTGKILSMARQHPATQMRGLLEMMSVTRRARTMRNKPDEDPDSKDLRDFFMSLSKPSKQK